MSDVVKKCKHKGCGCVAAKGSDYCSTMCKDSSGTLSLQCNCGHEACNAEKL